MPTLLLVDDEPHLGYTFRRAFGDEGVTVRAVATVAEGIRQFEAEQPDVVVLDLQLPDGSGLEVFEAIRAIRPRTPVIFMTAHGTTQTAIEAMRHGAFDYLVKPVNFERLRDLLQRAFETARLMQVPAVLPPTEPVDRIVGHSPAMQEMCKTIGRVAPQEVNVLIQGESGTGKELVARAIYHNSRRVGHPFLAINCAALPENLVESELFGHEKGAFTGADRRRVGKFEQCNGGTIFLDEIGDMPPGTQAKMLRLLQEQRFERVGGAETIQTQVRILAATNQDLEGRMAEGKFRGDLYYRLRVVSIAVPSLRERGDDVLELAHHFLYLFNQELELSIRGFDAEALACLQAYRWPGNVRELQSVVKEAMLRTTGPIVLLEFLPPELRAVPPATHIPNSRSEGFDLDRVIEELLKQGNKDLHAQVIRQVEEILFARVLRETGGHLAQASARLGLNRSTLRYKLRDLGLTPEG